jgi:hypothetical protein
VVFGNRQFIIVASKNNFYLPQCQGLIRNFHKDSRHPCFSPARYFRVCRFRIRTFPFRLECIRILHRRGHHLRLVQDLYFYVRNRDIRKHIVWDFVHAQTSVTYKIVKEY